jgi:hypothetical protein
MGKEYPLGMLLEGWIDFLHDCGHSVELLRETPNVVVSHGKKDNSFRWLLFVAAGRVEVLRPAERKNLVNEIQNAQKAKQKPYVVVRFELPAAKIIVKPADKVLQTGRIGSARGGIAWLG